MHHQFHYEDYDHHDGIKMPSIHDFDIDLKHENHEDDKQNHRQSFMRSFMKLDEDWAPKKQSLRDIVSFTNIMGENDLFYLSHH